MKYIQTLFNKQKKFFESNVTLDVVYRKQHLTKLLDNITIYEEEVNKALQLDLNKTKEESYISEISLVRNEIKMMLKHIHKWSKTRRVHRNKMIMLSKSYIRCEPYGVTLICAP
jgi:aldehyde dehydrogenase (NAD+)